MQVVRVGLSWRAASPSKPGVGTFDDPDSYTWGQYDAVVKEAKARGMNVMFSILWTPGWAGGGATGNGNRAPTNMAWLQSFAIAAATRYSGDVPGSASAFPGATLPRVRYWTAWNEPNAPLFLKPQYKRRQWPVGDLERSRVREDVLGGLPRRS